MGKNDVNCDAACELVKADKYRKGLHDTISIQGLLLDALHRGKWMSRWDGK